MAEKNHQPFQDSWWFQYGDHHMENNGKCTPSTTNNTSSIGDESTVSNGSSDAATDDASSSASSPFSANSNPFRSLYNMSEIMTQLPIKRGLSKFYQGKSESFTSVLRVRDLAKKANACSRKNMNACSKSYKSYILPKHVIAKNITRASPFSSKKTVRD